jgi:hypothetical protein
MHRIGSGNRIAVSSGRVLLALGLAAVASGCANGDVELNGKLFDAIGISSAAQSAAKREPQLAARAPLVMPPDQTRLPEPGGVETAAINDQNWPVDPDQKKQLAAAERDRLHQEYCSGRKNWQQQAFDKNAGAPKSPYGPCNAFIGNMFSSATQNARPEESATGKSANTPPRPGS